MEIVERDLSAPELRLVHAGFATHALEHGNPSVEEYRITFVAIQNDTFIGCSSGLINENGKWLYLTDLFVVPEHRGSGVGHQLLSLIEKKSVSLDVENVWTRTAFEAILFYQARGYEVIFELENYYQSGHSHIGIRKRL